MLDHRVSAAGSSQGGGFFWFLKWLRELAVDKTLAEALTLHYL